MKRRLVIARNVLRDLNTDLSKLAELDFHAIPGSMIMSGGVVAVMVEGDTGEFAFDDANKLIDSRPIFLKV